MGKLVGPRSANLLQFGGGVIVPGLSMWSRARTSRAAFLPLANDYILLNWNDLDGAAN